MNDQSDTTERAWEIAQIMGFVHALCPAQRLDEFTPDAWELVLDGISVDDAKAALKTLGQQLRFIAPADIAGEVRRARNTRQSFPPGTGHHALEADIAAVDRSVDAAGYIRALRAKPQKVAGPPMALGAAISVERTFVDVPSKRPRTARALERQHRTLAIEAAPAADAVPVGDVELAIADAVLAELPDWWTWMQAARAALEAERFPATRRAVTVRAAELATADRPEP